MDKQMMRNLNAHKPALMAKFLYCARYGDQYGGVMDFWDTVSDAERETCRECVQEILDAREEA